MRSELLGADFVALCDRAVIGRILTRLVAGIGEPFGDSPEVMQLKAIEWFNALNDLPAKTVDDAVSEWIKTGTKWPKPAEIRKIAEAKLEVRVDQVSSERQVHHRRLNPTDTMKAFNYQTSRLRDNPTWRKFLDTIHPTQEHCFFAKAQMLRFASEIRVQSAFEADYIADKLGEALTAAFGRSVVIEYPGGTRFTREEFVPPTAEEKAKVSALLAGFLRRNTTHEEGGAQA